MGGREREKGSEKGLKVDLPLKEERGGDSKRVFKWKEECVCGSEGGGGGEGGRGGWWNGGDRGPNVEREE